MSSNKQTVRSETQNGTPMDRISELYYGKIFTAETAEIARSRVHWMNSQCAGETVLDVGCSQGIVTILLAREGFRVTGLDIHPQAIAYAQDASLREPRSVQERITWIEGDFTNFSPAEPFDSVVLGEILEHQTLPAQFLALAIPCVRPNGRIIITTPFGLHPHPDHKSVHFSSHLVEMAAELGLRVEHLEIQDGYIRMTLLNDPELAASYEDWDKLLRKTELGTLALQEKLYAQVHKKVDQIKKLKATEKTLQQRLEASEAERERLVEEHLAAKETLKSIHEQALDAERNKHQHTLEEMEAHHAEELHMGKRHERKLEDKAKRQAKELRRKIAASEARVEAIRQKLSFKLGELLITGFDSPSAFLKLPWAILRLLRSAYARRKLRRDKTPTVLMGSAFERLLSLYDEGGLEAVRSWLQKADTPSETRATGYTALARHIQPVRPVEAAEIAREAYCADPRPHRAKWLAFRLFEAGHLSEPFALLSALPTNHKLSSSEKAKTKFISGCYRLLHNLPTIPQSPAVPAYDAEPDRILYVASSSLPYNTTGYTLRTQELLTALREQGWNVLCVTRPGYPADRDDAVSVTVDQTRYVDGVCYEALPGPHRRKTPLDVYLTESARIMVNKILTYKPAVIHAASNYEAALPAMHAAKELGIPFAYEVRGLWEYTSASKRPGWEQTERFWLDKLLETYTASAAEIVFTLNKPLCEELVTRGVSEELIKLVPNAINPIKFTPIQRDNQLCAMLGIEKSPLVIGYIGSIVPYEGLNDLISAFGLVRREIQGAKLLIVGGGNLLTSLREQARGLGLEQDITFTGKVHPDDVLRYFSLLDVVAIPRKPFKVCELVPPLKPIEAMAMKVPLVVSDVAALADIVTRDRTGLVHEASNIESLASCLLRLGNDPALRRSLAESASQEVVATKTWSVVSQIIGDVYLDLLHQTEDTVRGANL